MKVVILGAGRRGIRLAKHLVEENKDVIIMDEDADDVNNAMTRVDCLAVMGSGTNLDDLREAGLDNANAFIALTGSDETNLVSCGIAATEFKVPLTIASIRNLSYSTSNGASRSLMGISHIVNPNEEAASHIYQDIERGIYSDIISFDTSSLVLYNVYVEKASQYANRAVKKIRQEIKANFIIAALNRNGEAIVPSGDTLVMPGDTLSLVAKEDSVETILQTVGRRRQKPRKIAIVGAGEVTDFLIRKFTPVQQRNLILIEKNKETCEAIANKYPNVLVLNADITSEGLIKEENLSNRDLILCLTDSDELNIITASYAKHFGIKNSMALVTRNPNYIRMASHMDIDSVISTQDVTVDSLKKYLHGNNIASMHSLFDGQIEAFEVQIPENGSIAGKLLKDIDMRGKGIIAGVTKPNSNTIIPGGLYKIQANDKLVLVIERKYTQTIQELLGIEPSEIVENKGSAIENGGNENAENKCIESKSFENKCTESASAKSANVESAEPCPKQEQNNFAKK